MNIKSANPFFSIVIANYNSGKFLSAAIESILHQNCDDYEIIVVDGGSSDNSVEVIKTYANSIAWWVSEPDKGQSNAFNKGFAHASGRFFTWLNADDLLLPGTLKAVKKALESHPYAQWATGNMIRFIQDEGEIIEAPWGPNFLPRWLQGKGRVSVSFGPTTFWSQKAYALIGPLDESLHIAMDIDYWYRLDKAGFRQVRVNHLCWGFRMHEASKTAEFGEHKKEGENKLAIIRENEYVVDKNNYHPLKIWRCISLMMRCFDGSIMKSIFNRCFLVGKKLHDVCDIQYDAMLGK